MSSDNLAACFKNKIAFHGGISIQTTLPFAAAEEVRRELIHTIETLGPLKLIVAPDQELIGDIPTGNIEVMYQTVRDWKI